MTDNVAILFKDANCHRIPAQARQRIFRQAEADGSTANFSIFGGQCFRFPNLRNALAFIGWARDIAPAAYIHNPEDYTSVKR
jgi:hypothetical protein